MFQTSDWLQAPSSLVASLRTILERRPSPRGEGIYWQRAKVGSDFGMRVENQLISLINGIALTPKEANQAGDHKSKPENVEVATWRKSPLGDLGVT